MQLCTPDKSFPGAATNDTSTFRSADRWGTLIAFSSLLTARHLQLGHGHPTHRRAPLPRHGFRSVRNTKISHYNAIFTTLAAPLLFLPTQRSGRWLLLQGQCPFMALSSSPWVTVIHLTIMMADARVHISFPTFSNVSRSQWSNCGNLDAVNAAT